jgi:hypothetical protein
MSRLRYVSAMMRAGQGRSQRVVLLRNDPREGSDWWRYVLGFTLGLATVVFGLFRTGLVESGIPESDSPRAMALLPLGVLLSVGALWNLLSEAGVLPRGLLLATSSSVVLVGRAWRGVLKTVQRPAHIRVGSHATTMRAWKGAGGTQSLERHTWYVHVGDVSMRWTERKAMGERTRRRWIAAFDDMGYDSFGH